MFRDIWKNYHRYFKVSYKESNLAILLGIFGAFLETFSIYLLANIITSLGYENTEFNNNDGNGWIPAIVTTTYSVNSLTYETLNMSLISTDVPNVNSVEVIMSKI